MNTLDQQFWNHRYETEATGWDLGEACPAFVHYFAQVKNKQLHILIPGAGNAYEADELLNLGFQHITIVDIAPLLVTRLSIKYKDEPRVKVLCDDFFMHQGKYDIVMEQTFFCAISPRLRENYVIQMHQILNHNGFIVGVLFNRSFEGGPPFGGSASEYQRIFEPYFNFEIFEECKHSALPRKGTELFIKLRKKEAIL